MTEALAAVNNGMSVRKAAEKFSVPKSTLSDRVTGRIEPGSTWGKPSKLTKIDENKLIDTAIERAERGVGFTKKTFLRYAGAFAAEKGHPFKKGTPSDM